MRACVRWLAIVTTMALLVLSALSIPAQADGRLQLSNAGVRWDPALRHPLFESGIRWVPGDSRTRTFYVRNASGQSTLMAVDLLGVGRDGLLKTGDLSITARSAGGTWSTVRTTGRHRLLSDVKLSARSAQQVRITASFDGDSGNVSQTLALDLRFRVILTQDVSGTGPDIGPGQPDQTDPAPTSPGGLLAATGGPVLWLLLGGLALVASGASLLRRRVDVRGDA